MVSASVGPVLRARSLIFRNRYLCNYFATGMSMSEDLNIGQTKKRADLRRARKPGRPHAIPDSFSSTVVELYRDGNGYRSIARILESDYGLSVDYSSVRRALLRNQVTCH